VLDEELDRVIRVVAMTDQVLAAHQGLQRRVRRRLPEGAQVVPGIVAHAEVGLEGGAAERLDRVEADGVHLLRDRQDLGRPQTPTQKRLVAVPESCVGEPQARLVALRHYLDARACRRSV
jgi:hypothetical protein